MVTVLALGYVILVNILGVMLNFLKVQGRPAFTRRQALIVAGLNLLEALAIFGLWRQSTSAVETVIAIGFWLFELSVLIHLFSIVGKPIDYLNHRILWSAISSIIAIALASVLAFM